MSQAFRALFGPKDRDRPLLVGVVHLLPLPGAPRHRPAAEGRGGMNAVIEHALADASSLQAGGARAIIVENFGDEPFHADRVPPVTTAAMARAVAELRREARVPLGVNVLRSDAEAALGIAAACDADFIRVNVHTGAMVTDQGLIQGRAAGTVRLRRALGSAALIFADILVKHASPLAPLELEQAAEDTYLRGAADALLVTGSGTGKPASLEDAARVRAALPSAPLLVASGVTLETAAAWFAACDGAVVGTWVKREGDVSNPVDAERVKQLVAAARG
ncbi:MAG: BtpA/SgcQ family protein [Candidatus Eisenbacteria bacterium]|nr:BtpA/SgcQ family protein [Candidatus Eisenbacteria bacterium]